MKILGAHHLAIQVADLPRAEAFYRGVLGLSVIRRWPAADDPAERSVWLDAGDGSFLALEVVPDRAAASGDAGGPGLHLLALRVAPRDRSAWEVHLAQAGFPVTHRTEFTLYTRDPEGNRIGLSHHPEPA